MNGAHRHRIRMLSVTLLVLVAAAAPAGAIDLESWDLPYPASLRFEVLPQFGMAAVLDHETQLVWELVPEGIGDWTDAREACINKVVGGTAQTARKGWRLPVVYELTSLVDRSVSSSPRLPDGHPFVLPPTGVPAASGPRDLLFWTASTQAPTYSDQFEPPDFVWTVSFTLGRVGAAGKEDSALIWCVRGSVAGPDRY